MKRKSFWFEETDDVALGKIAKQYGCPETQALRLAIRLVADNLPLLVDLPPNPKRGPKPKKKSKTGNHE